MKNKRIVVVPTQWAIYEIRDDVYEAYNTRDSIPKSVLLETLVGMRKAKRLAVTGFHPEHDEESIIISGGDDEGGDDDFLDD